MKSLMIKAKIGGFGHEPAILKQVLRDIRKSAPSAELKAAAIPGMVEQIIAMPTAIDEPGQGSVNVLAVHNLILQFQPLFDLNPALLELNLEGSLVRVARVMNSIFSNPAIIDELIKQDSAGLTGVEIVFEPNLPAISSAMRLYSCLKTGLGDVESSWAGLGELPLLYDDTMFNQTGEAGVRFILDPKEDSPFNVELIRFLDGQNLLPFLLQLKRRKFTPFRTREHFESLRKMLALTLDCVKGC